MSANSASLESTEVRTIPQNGNLPTPTIIITLDDGYTCIMNATLFTNQVGYIRRAFSNRPLNCTEHKIHIPGVRRDLWFSLQNTITLNKGLLISAPPSEYKGRTDMAQAGKFDIRIRQWDCEIHQLLELIIIGEHLDAPSFQNDVMDKLILTYKKYYRENEGRVPLGNVEYVFANSQNECLRNFVADVLSFAMSVRMASQALKEGHLSEGTFDELGMRGNGAEDGVRDAPWDHEGDYQQEYLVNPNLF